ncbi:T9SS type A sorting domain-containing protein [Cognatitamlana onchidii]|uniref:T9SS type A sorting domain-containing protein n=1 Tax=Cognatitamlana onchidii TaxID=2562860 RepID=UPI0014561818|nr:T9SS type A sorting domain-containing protein [Algibacter onchidii]
MKSNIAPILIYFSLFISTWVYGQFNPIATIDPNDTWQYEQTYSDEFNSNTIDWSKWSKTTNLPNVSAWKWNNDTNVTPGTFEGENAVEITMRHNENNIPVDGTYFNSGCMQNTTQLPAEFIGYVEARIYGAFILSREATVLDRRRGVCPAFWLYSDFYDNKPIGEAVYTEIDVVELQQFDYDALAPPGERQDDIHDAESNLHLVLNSSSGREWFRPKQPNARDEQLNKYELPGRFDPALGWHTYACEITPTELHFFVDGIKVGRTLNNTYWSDNPLKVIVSLGLRVPFVTFSDNRFQPLDPVTNDRASKNLGEIPTSMYLDYVRVWSKSTLSLDDKSKSTFKIYPNPSNGFITIKGKENMELSIYNTTGQMVYKTTYSPSNNQIDLSNLKSGVYIIEGKADSSIFRTKLIIK